MRLQWKYTLIINLFIITFMALFFVIDDIKLRKDRIEGQIKDISRGVLIRDIADVLKTTVQDLSDVRMIERELRSVVREMGLEGQIVDVNVTDETGRIIASLKGWEIGNVVNLDREGYEGILQGRIQIYRLARYHDEWVTEAIITYPRSARFDDDSNIVIENGLIQILFAAPDVANYLSTLRLIHMIYVVVTSISLAFLINLLTTRMVIRPLESLVEIIQRADEGDLNVPFIPHMKGEIGRVSLRLANMLRQIKRAHRERIEALGRMASGVAHEIRNPLNSISMTVQYLKSLISPGEMSEEELKEAQECLDVIDKQVDRLSQITDQFLTLNRPPSLQIKPADLEELIEEVLYEFSATFSNTNISVIKRYCGQLTDVPVDSSKIRQALYNLIQNAVQAMPKGGKIYITTQLEKGRFLDRAIIEIRDTGVGIPDDIQPRVFDAYFTTREKEGGVGLGLSLTYQIVEAHQGKIELKSKVGMGTSFKIILPIRRSEVKG
jgi:signal transduction histidine kinase